MAALGQRLDANAPALAFAQANFQVQGTEDAHSSPLEGIQSVVDQLPGYSAQVVVGVLLIITGKAPGAECKCHSATVTEGVPEGLRFGVARLIVLVWCLPFQAPTGRAGHAYQSASHSPMLTEHGLVFDKKAGATIHRFGFGAAQAYAQVGRTRSLGLRQGGTGGQHKGCAKQED